MQELVIFSAIHRLLESCDKPCKTTVQNFTVNHTTAGHCCFGSPYWTFPQYESHFFKSIFKCSCFKYYRQNIWLWRIIRYTDGRGSKIQFIRPVEAHGNVEIYYHQILCRLCMTWTRRNLSVCIPAAGIELQLEILTAQLNLTTTQLSDEFISQTSKIPYPFLE